MKWLNGFQPFTLIFTPELTFQNVSEKKPVVYLVVFKQN